MKYNRNIRESSSDVLRTFASKTSNFDELADFYRQLHTVQGGVFSALFTDT